MFSFWSFCQIPQLFGKHIVVHFLCIYLFKIFNDRCRSRWLDIINFTINSLHHPHFHQIMKTVIMVAKLMLFKIFNTTLTVVTIIVLNITVAKIAIIRITLVRLTKWWLKFVDQMNLTSSHAFLQNHQVLCNLGNIRNQTTSKHLQKNKQNCQKLCNEANLQTKISIFCIYLSKMRKTNKWL